ncbi:uncharacterized protein SCHCODRAFT_02107420 [Schizophyllum commune H4-8]|uniref:uncharacterized protein n=1 Tax=Schizophyllum commune (strain H4-8 / FGSC 9210) TaxID=578458 RepID=UPI00215FC891|nr:uncharacterized protein SCHCODRAFT_02107420 [Schizophyllum commune H4-8]KAI5885885.1 hypothetical protein SCHCODRAFT_02107420 [Schizophyllum commune H4-8]
MRMRIHFVVRATSTRRGPQRQRPPIAFRPPSHRARSPPPSSPPPSIPLQLNKFPFACLAYDTIYTYRPTTDYYPPHRFLPSEQGDLPPCRSLAPDRLPPLHPLPSPPHLNSPSMFTAPSPFSLHTSPPLRFSHVPPPPPLPTFPAPSPYSSLPHLPLSKDPAALTS